jgi:hypothetical protein
MNSSRGFFGGDSGHATGTPMGVMQTGVYRSGMFRTSLVTSG